MPQLQTSTTGSRSYGVLLWELFTLGEAPYPDYEAGPEFINALLRDQIRLPRPNGAPEEIFDRVMSECWNEDPMSRPHFECIAEIFSGLVVVDRRHLPTLESASRSSSLKRQRPVIDNQLYWMQSDSNGGTVDNDTDVHGYLLTVPRSKPKTKK